MYDTFLCTHCIRGYPGSKLTMRDGQQQIYILLLLLENYPNYLKYKTHVTTNIQSD